MRVACFDLGGVLVEINHRWKGALLDAGMPRELACRFDVALTEFDAFNAYQKGELDWGRYVEQLAHLFDGMDTERAGRVHGCILRSAYPGIPVLLDQVRAAGIKTGCLSNTNAPHWEAMMHAPRLAVVANLDFPLASHLVGAEKPEEKMYVAFEEASGASPRQIAYFDDSPANVEAARRRGWDAILVDPLGDPAAQIHRHLERKGWLA
jgi:FMN phosphatase YigB (HAD superfamily)